MFENCFIPKWQEKKIVPKKCVKLGNITKKILKQYVTDISVIRNKNSSWEDSNTEMKVDRPGKTIEVAFITEISH